MRIKIRRTCFLLCLAVAAGICLAASPASADDASDQVSVQMSLLTSGRFSQGEPVVLQYGITNSSDQNLVTYMGVDEKAWATEHLIDEQGQDVPPLPDVLPTRPGGLHSVGPRIEPHRSYRDDLVVSQRFAITSPGNYTLSVHVSLPYGPMGRDRSKFSTVYTQDFTFPIVVTPSDPARLKSVAETYLQKAVNEKGAQWRRWYVDALFSMPEAEALPSWQTLASSPNVGMAGRSRIVSDLLRLHSEAAADIMADMIWRPAQSPETVAVAPANKLADMFLIGDSALKDHIKQIYASHGLVMPDKPVIGQVND